MSVFCVKIPEANTPFDFGPTFGQLFTYLSPYFRFLSFPRFQKGEYTNVNKFTLRCENCGKGLVGQKEAVAHFKETGHSNFAEYR